MARARRCSARGRPRPRLRASSKGRTAAGRRPLAGDGQRTSVASCLRLQRQVRTAPSMPVSSPGGGSNCSTVRRTTPSSPSVAEHDAVVGRLPAAGAAARPALRAAHVENVREVGLEMQEKGELHRLGAVVLDPQPLVADTLPNELRSGQVQRAERQPRPAVAQQVRVGERDDELVVVSRDHRAQEQRPAAVELEQQAGEEARALVIQALLADPAGIDVAVAIEDSERVAVPEHAVCSSAGLKAARSCDGGRRPPAVAHGVATAERSTGAPMAQNRTWSSRCRPAPAADHSPCAARRSAAR